jgi:hypothetical protein
MNTDFMLILLYLHTKGYYDCVRPYHITATLALRWSAFRITSSPWSSYKSLEMEGLRCSHRHTMSVPDTRYCCWIGLVCMSLVSLRKGQNLNVKLKQVYNKYIFLFLSIPKSFKNVGCWSICSSCNLESRSTFLPRKYIHLLLLLYGAESFLRS